VVTTSKFTTPEGANRCLTFSEPPAWSLLASKLHVLYRISLDNVGVSYVDNDDDEITLSSDEELQDFYKMSHQPGQVIKFAVVDLHASQNNAGKPRSFNRNPFDADPFEFIGEWENFPAVLVEDLSPFPSQFALFQLAFSQTVPFQASLVLQQRVQPAPSRPSA
jgi:PB1 domain